MNHFQFGPPVNRRDFFRSSIAGMCALAAFPVVGGSTAQKKNQVVIGSLLPANNDPQTRSLAHGFQMGAEEAMRASSLFSQPLRIARNSYGSARDIDAQVTQMKSAGVAVIIGGGADDDCRAIAEACASAGVVYLDAACRSDALRRDSCSPFVFHVEASDAMYAAAGELSNSHQVLLWHPGLARYGASQVNDRYRAQFVEPMNGTAWAAWVSAKIAWESGLRTAGAGARAIAGLLATDGTQFDGHKGAPLSFRTWDHQLRQPLYAVTNAGGKERVTDVPDLAKSARPARELLDELGDRTSAHACAENHT